MKTQHDVNVYACEKHYKIVLLDSESRKSMCPPPLDV